MHKLQLSVSESEAIILTLLGLAKIKTVHLTEKKLSLLTEHKK